MIGPSGPGCTHLDPIDQFEWPSEYDRFLRWIDERIADGTVEQVPVAFPYAGGSHWDERWFRCTACGQLWRLIGPEPPLLPFFKRVDPIRPQG